MDGAGDDAAGGGGGMLGGLDTGGGGGGGYGGAGGVGGTGPQATGGSAGAAYGTSGSTTDQFVQEGSGGGGGGGKGATDTGGTGGAGGARIRLVAAETGSSFTGGGAVNANGGAGSNGTNGDRSAGGGGGGAGGGVYFRAATINFTGTVSVAGGNGGTVGTTANIAETPPSAVTLSGLSATFDADGAAMVRWSTSTELDTVGFHVLRSTSPDGSFERINDGLVLAKRPGGIFGADYTFTDPTGLPRQVYAYKIEELDFKGDPIGLYGPFSIGQERGIITEVTVQGQQGTAVSADWKDHRQTALSLEPETAVNGLPAAQAGAINSNGSGNRTTLLIAIGLGGSLALLLAAAWAMTRRRRDAYPR